MAGGGGRRVSSQLCGRMLHRMLKAATRPEAAGSSGNGGQLRFLPKLLWLPWETVPHTPEEDRWDLIQPFLSL